MESHEQGAALAALGRYFELVEHKPDQASRCSKKALALDPSLADAGGAWAGFVGTGGAGAMLEGGLRSGPPTPPLAGRVLVARRESGSEQ